MRGFREPSPIIETRLRRLPENGIMQGASDSRLTVPRKRTNIAAMPVLQSILKLRLRFAPVAAAALLCCLLAGASLHVHKSGWHALHDCAICTFEDSVTHGAALAIPPVHAHVRHDSFLAPFLRRITAVSREDAAPIRAPPLFSFNSARIS